MPLNKPDQTTSAMPGHVASTDGLGLSEWMPLHEAKRLAKLWTNGCDFDNAPQWRAVVRVLLDEANRVDAAVAAERDPANVVFHALLLAAWNAPGTRTAGEMRDAAVTLFGTAAVDAAIARIRA